MFYYLFKKRQQSYFYDFLFVTGRQNILQLAAISLIFAGSFRVKLKKLSFTANK